MTGLGSPRGRGSSRRMRAHASGDAVRPEGGMQSCRPLTPGFPEPRWGGGAVGGGGGKGVQTGSMSKRDDSCLARAARMMRIAAHAAPHSTPTQARTSVHSVSRSRRSNVSAQGASGLPFAVVLLSGGALLPLPLLPLSMLLLLLWDPPFLELAKALVGAEGRQAPEGARNAIIDIAKLITRITMLYKHRAHWACPAKLAAARATAAVLRCTLGLQAPVARFLLRRPKSAQYQS